MGSTNRFGGHGFHLGGLLAGLQFARTWPWLNQYPQGQQCFTQTSKPASKGFPGLIATLLFCALLVPTDSVARMSQLEAPASWQSMHFQDHLLVGTVWRGNGRPASWQELTKAVRTAQLLLVGEVHPNPDHHRLQAAVLGAVVANGKPATVVWEMIPSARQAVLDEWSMARAPDASALGRTLEWSESGWPAWSLYQPIARVAAQKNLKMIGTALPREMMMNIGRKGADGIAAKLRARLHLDVTLDKQAQAGLMNSLREGHCDLMPEAALAPMSVAQRARDGAMADAMLRASISGPSVLIAGNGHIRQDWGVGGLLSRLSPQAQTLSIAQIEVQADQFDPTKYFEQHDAANGFDFLVFTPKAEIKDYCAELRTRFGKGK